MTRLRLIAVLSSVLAVGTAGCHRQRATVPEPTTTGTTTTTTTTTSRSRADSIAAAQRTADSLAAAQRAAAAQSAAELQRSQAEMNATLAEKVYFDYDQDQLRSEAAATLDAKAAILLANPSVTLAITGHTDERGTAEYNLALGQRRAAQVKRYLVSKGIADERLTTQSMGDSEPVASGTDEASYQQNRRAEFVAGNVSGALVRPRS